MDRIEIREVRIRLSVETKLSDKVEKYGLRRLGHVERMAKRICDAEVTRRRGRGRHIRVWMDGVKNSLRGRGLTFEQARVTASDRVE